MIKLTTDKLTVEENEPVILSVSTDSPNSEVLIMQQVPFLPDATLASANTDEIGNARFIFAFPRLLSFTDAPAQRTLYAVLTKRLWIDEKSNLINILIYPVGALAKAPAPIIYPGQPVPVPRQPLPTEPLLPIIRQPLPTEPLLPKVAGITSNLVLAGILLFAIVFMSIRK